MRGRCCCHEASINPSALAETSGAYPLRLASQVRGRGVDVGPSYDVLLAAGLATKPDAVRGKHSIKDASDPLGQGFPHWKVCEGA